MQTILVNMLLLIKRISSINSLKHRQTSSVLQKFSSSTTASSGNKNSPLASSLHQAKIDNIKKNVVEYRHIYPEFLPDPKVEFRNSVREKLERQDMIARRTQIDIPEFYVGSILAITSSDPHTPGKSQRFVGICIERKGCGLRSNFILRNVIDHQGVEILYEMYDPSIISVDVLKLEKRLDSSLLYLRDALPEYSTFDPNMEQEITPEGNSVPINPIKVKLKPRPWVDRWERHNLKGVQDLELTEKLYERAKKLEKPWEKYDLMKQYMRTIPEEEQKEIFTEVQSQLHKIEITQKQMKRKRTFVKPTKLA